MTTEQRNDVIVVMPRGLQIHQKRPFPRDPQRGGREYGSFNAVRTPLPQNAARRQTCGAPAFLVGRESVQKVLDFARRIETFQKRHFRTIKSEHVIIVPWRTCPGLKRRIFMLYWHRSCRPWHGELRKESSLRQYPTTIVITGGVGTGKTAQGELLVDSTGGFHWDCGDVLREERDQKTEIGNQVGKFQDKGKLVPDEILIPFFIKTSGNFPWEKPVILTGIPRTSRQANVVVRLTQVHVHRPEIVTFLLEVPDDVVIERCVGRNRGDDTPRIIKKRIRDEMAVAETMAEILHRHGSLYRIKGDQTREQVHADVMAILAPRAQKEATA